MPTHTPTPKKVALSTGVLSLHTKTAHPNWRMDTLLDFAERINPKRAFLFVSRVLGRHIPVTPDTMRRAFSDLATMVDDELPTPMLVIGMAETATGLGAGVHACLEQRYPQALFATTTRHNTDAPIAVQFLEEHSHAKEQKLYAPADPAIASDFFASKTLIIVDDELSTGKTVINLVNALKTSGFDELKTLIVLSLVDWTTDGWLDPLSKQGLHCQSLSLLKGGFDWCGTISLPNNQETPKQTATALAPNTPSWGRIPTRQPPTLPTFEPTLLATLTAKKHPKVLVLGVGEYVWLPFLLAEVLQNRLATGIVHVGAITRSPIKEGLAIKHKITLSDPYGTDTPYFLYNVKKEDYDAILVASDSKQIDPALWQALPNAQLIELI